ncbi:acetylglutamate kinase [Clostridia bacterium]|nr:acetylglutamate kinase [Clostridia bacterium]
MIDQYVERARVLSEALPYIQKFSDKTIVVKYGGSAMLNDELKRLVLSDIILLSLVGIRVVVVHGGGPEISDMMNRLGIESRFVGGMRYTDEQTMEVVQMVLCGKVNKDLVNMITGMGGRSIGLCGLDGGMITASRLRGGEVDYGMVGEIKSIDASPVVNALSSGYIPVISTVAGGDEPGAVFNINADIAASKLAIEMKAEKLVLLTDVRGLLRDRNDESTLIPVVEPSNVPKFIRDGIISGGMIPKVDCCVEAVRRGVARAHILDGRIPHSLLIEMLSNEGVGTMFV